MCITFTTTLPLNPTVSFIISKCIVYRKCVGWHQVSAGVCVHARMHMCVCVHTHMCVCVCEKERLRERKRGQLCVCTCVMYAHMCMCRMHVGVALCVTDHECVHLHSV